MNANAVSLAPALFLDRDGVININHGYVHKRENFEFIDGIFDLARAAHERGMRIVVVTNQAGIGRGYYGVPEFLALTAWMEARFAEAGGPIAATYFCPHHPEAAIDALRRDCDCRKPQPGMLLQAQRDLGIDLPNSMLVGDAPTDIVAAKRAGVGTTVRFGEAHPVEDEDEEAQPTIRFARHADIAAWLRQIR